MILKMPNGATEDFYFPNSEQMDRWIKPRLEYSDLPILSGGPACRVHFKSGSYENVEGEIVQVREITRFEWL